MEIRAYGQKATKSGVINDPIAKDLLQRAKRGIGDDHYKILADAFDKVTGRSKADRQIGELLQNTMTFNTVTQLSLTGLTQLSQLAATVGQFGFFRSFKGMLEVITDRRINKELAKRGGALLESFAEITGNRSSLFLETYFRLTGISPIDNAGRILAFNIGKDWVLDLFSNVIKNPTNKFALNELMKIRSVNWTKVFKRGHMLSSEIADAAKYLSDWTQVRPNSFNLPMTWRTGMGRFITQYKSFAFASSKAILEMTTNPAKFFRFGVTNAAVGELIANAKALIRGKERESDPGKRLAENIGNGYGFGLLFDTLMSARYGASQVISGAVGPGIGLGADVIESVIKLPEGPAKLVLKRLGNALGGQGRRFTQAVFPTEGERTRGGR
jgi:hypothetical protein